MKARHDAQPLLAKGVIHPFIGVFTDGRHLTECHGQKKLINHNILQVALCGCFYPMSWNRSLTSTVWMQESPLLKWLSVSMDLDGSRDIRSFSLLTGFSSYFHLLVKLDLWLCRSLDIIVSHACAISLSRYRDHRPNKCIVPWSYVKPPRQFGRLS